MNFQAPEIAISLRTYLRVYFHRMQGHKLLWHAFRTHPLVLNEQTGCTAATELVLTAVILNGSEASGPLTNGKVYI